MGCCGRGEKRVGGGRGGVGGEVGGSHENEENSSEGRGRRGEIKISV